VYACVKVGKRTPAWPRRQREVLRPATFERTSPWQPRPMPGAVAAPVPFSPQRLPDRWFVPLVGGLPSETITARPAYSTRSIVPALPRWFRPLLQVLAPLC